MKIENISMQIKNEKSSARSMSDEDLVRPVRPGLIVRSLKARIVTELTKHQTLHSDSSLQYHEY